MNFFTKLMAGAALSALIAGSANAADVYTKGGLKDEPFIDVNVVNFSGGYVGVGVGGVLLEDDYNDELSGFVGEGVIGWDFRRASFVIGPRVKGAFASAESDNDLIELDGYANLGGRAGVVLNRTLIYGDLGYEFLFASSPNPLIDAALDDSNLRAITFGIGLETMISQDWSLAGEATYVHGMDDAKEIDGWRGIARVVRQF